MRSSRNLISTGSSNNDDFATKSNNVPTIPVFTYNASADADTIRADDPVFRTNLLIEGGSGTSLKYPFDE